MSDYTILNDISVTLLKLLKSNMAGIVAQDHISLASPADVEADTAPRLTLYLFQMVENQNLKNFEIEYSGSSTPCKPPLPLYLFYLLTAYATNRESEQQIIGKAIQIFYDKNIIRGSMLQGSLAGTFEELVIDLHTMPLDDMNKLWSMFGSKAYKLSATFRVSTALIDTTVAETEGNRVIQQQLNYSIPK
jgi:hypothetical protein